MKFRTPWLRFQQSFEGCRTLYAQWHKYLYFLGNSEVDSYGDEGGPLPLFTCYENYGKEGIWRGFPSK